MPSASPGPDRSKTGPFPVAFLPIAAAAFLVPRDRDVSPTATLMSLSGRCATC